MACSFAAAGSRHLLRAAGAGTTIVSWHVARCHRGHGRSHCASAPQQSPPPSSCRIGFCTDVEGNHQHWARYVERSEVLHYTHFGGIRLRPGCHFVFGGDAVDKGDGDFQVLRDLVLLRQRYPGRVHLLIGNRDANKLRLAQELSEAELRRPCRQVYFRHPTRGASPGPAADAAERLRWILSETMGSPDAFELRRAELSRTSWQQQQVVTDADVVKSFRDMAAPGGLMQEYLTLADFAVHYPEGVLFLHGAVDENNAGVLPFDTSDGPRLEVAEWCTRLNELVRTQMAEWCSGGWRAPGVWSEEGGWGGGGRSLMQYAMGTLPARFTGDTLVPGSNPSVVLRSWLRNGQPRLPAEKVQEYLRRSGVKAVLTGHQPHGDSPVLLRCAEDLVIVSADTSYSAHVLWGADRPGARVADAAATGNRGRAVSEVLVDVSGGRVSAVSVSAALSDGQPLRADLPVGGGVAPDRAGRGPGDGGGEAPNLAGRETKDGWWVKGRTARGWLCSRGEGFSQFNVVRAGLTEHDMRSG